METDHATAFVSDWNALNQMGNDAGCGRAIRVVLRLQICYCLLPDLARTKKSISGAL